MAKSVRVKRQPASGRRSIGSSLSSSTKWQKRARAFVTEYPFCVRCLCYGQVNEGAEGDDNTRQRLLVVDHVEPHRGDERLFWDWDNLQTLCRVPCHDKIKAVHELNDGTAFSWWQSLRTVIDTYKTDEFLTSFPIPDHVARQLT